MRYMTSYVVTQMNIIFLCEGNQLDTLTPVNSF